MRLLRRKNERQILLLSKNLCRNVEVAARFRTGCLTLLFVACAGLIPVVNQRSFAAHATNEIVVQSDGVTEATNKIVVQSDGVTDALTASFGSAVEAVTGFKPFFLTGDFNGDAMPDIVIAVRIKERRTALPKDVRLLNPFYGSPKVTYPSNPASENKMALAIIHSWKGPQPAAKFLLIGEGPILIFVYDRISDLDGAKNLMELMSKRGKRPRGAYFPPTAKGDVILLGTEVGSESPLYWNGKTYRWEELEGD